MDDKTAKRIDALYRNMSSFTLLTILSILVPLLLLFVIPLSLVYLYLRAKLLAQIDSGQIQLDRESAASSVDASGLTAIQKIEFIRHNAGRLWLPSIVLFGIVVVVAVLILLMNV
jgi:hypothetical protein